MTWAQEGTGTQTSVIGTEHTLDDSAANGTHVLAVRTSAMALGDRLELRAYVKVLTGDPFDATTLYRLWTVEHVQFEPVILSIPIPSRYGCRFTLKQTAGTGCAYPWELWTV